MKSFWSEILSRLKAGQNVFLALVVNHTKHSPGTTGARLWVDAQGNQSGTIGGGTMEYAVLQRASSILSGDSFTPELQTLHHRNTGDGEKSGMICGGSQTNLYYLCRPETDAHHVERILTHLQAGSSGSLYLRPEGLFVEDKEPELEKAQLHLTESADSWCFEEQLLNQKRIAILGGGHCGKALAQIMQGLDYAVQIFDERNELQELGLFDVDTKVLDTFEKVSAFITYPTLTPVIVMTTNVQSDIRSLMGVILHEYPFVGVMGAKTKIVYIFNALRERGIPEKLLAKIHAPVGISIGSSTPNEIAISVAGQLIQLRKA